MKFYSISEACIIIFDYFCDIEIHFGEKYEFYQVKTDKEVANYTIDRLIKLNKSNESILGKVYILKKKIDEADKESNKFVKSSVVSNIPLCVKEGKTRKRYSTPGEICLNIIDDKNKETIKNHLKEELGIEDVDFNSIFFEYTMMDLKNLNDILIAKTLDYAKKVLGKQPKNLEGLCAMIMFEVEKRACYEFECSTYEELLEYKGLTKKILNDSIIEFEGISDDMIYKIKEEINYIYKENFFVCCQVKIALSNILERINKDLNLKKKEESVLNYLKENLSNLKCSELEVIECLKEKEFFYIEDNEAERIALIIYVLTKFKEGYYE
ncbi:dsDNA nuclease domain-containing protein [Clostridium perfringens]|uniref:dsDNA nuclease domain-containing protein n=1 Tax=Clostridium perfringens TaxID=1502 RepID=UPI0039E7C858